MNNKDEFSTIDAICDEYEAKLRKGDYLEIEKLLQQVPVHLRSQLCRELVLLEKELLSDEQFQARIHDLWSELSEYGETLEDLIALPQVREEGSSAVPNQIGRYRLLKTIGEGGMGSVYLAEQSEPVKRQVALKVIKSGMDSKQIIARFEAERQALALMDHPSISRILDAGTTELGQPFFAMEYVDGVPLTEYCDLNCLSIAKRLELFRQICNGMQHAHQKGIIHRDLKPANILVTEHDGRPVPKIIDFGLAKALEVEHQLTDKTLFTEFGQVMGTLKYMSPEQAGLDTLDIDTRSDIYTLGVILYELLTGSTPLDSDTLKGQALLKVLELVREHEAARPSSRLSHSGEKSATVIENRNINFRKLSQVLSGDLDWIVMKAIDKDRHRRYETVGSFAEDIRRFLEDEPVDARPPSTSYKVSKFVKKNRGFVIASSLVLLMLAGGIVTSSWFAMKADKARQLAEANSRRAVSNESKALANEQKALSNERKAIASEKAAVKSRNEAVNAVEEFFTIVSESDLLNVPGMQSLRSKLLEKATSYYETLLAEQDDDVSTVVLSTARANYAAMIGTLGQVEKSHKILEEAYRDIQKFELDNSLPIRVIKSVGEIYMSYSDSALRRREFSLSKRVLTEHLAMFDKLEGHANKDDIEVSHALVLEKISAVEIRLGEMAKAKQALIKALDILENNKYREGIIGRFNVANLLTNLAQISDRSDALEHYRMAIQEREKILEFEADDLENLAALADLYSSLGYELRRFDYRGSFDAYGKAIDLFGSLHRQNPLVTDFKFGLAQSLDLKGFLVHQRYSLIADNALRKTGFLESLDLFARAEKLLAPNLDEITHQEVERLGLKDAKLLAMIFNGQALVMRDFPKPEECLEKYSAALKIQTLLAENAPEEYQLRMDIAGTWFNMGRSLEFFKNYKLAAEHYAKAIAIQRKLVAEYPEVGFINFQVVNAQTSLNTVLFYAGDLEAIEQEYRSTLALWPEQVRFAGVQAAVLAKRAEMQEAVIAGLTGNFEPTETLVENLQSDQDFFICLLFAAGVSKGLAEDPSKEKEHQFFVSIANKMIAKLASSKRYPHELLKEFETIQPFLVD